MVLCGYPVMAPTSFTCPCCLLTSHHPEDVARGYCGSCHAWTGDPDVMLLRLAGAYHDASVGQAARIPTYVVLFGPDGELVCHMPADMSPLGRQLVAGDVRRRLQLDVGFSDLAAAGGWVGRSSGRRRAC